MVTGQTISITTKHGNEIVGALVDINEHIVQVGLPSGQTITVDISDRSEYPIVHCYEPVAKRYYETGVVPPSFLRHQKNQHAKTWWFSDASKVTHYSKRGTIAWGNKSSLWAERVAS